eukprot:82388-Alexandrium_andersonii.AAC.1
MHACTHTRRHVHVYTYVWSQALARLSRNHAPCTHARAFAYTSSCVAHTCPPHQMRARGSAKQYSAPGKMIMPDRAMRSLPTSSELWRNLGPHCGTPRSNSGRHKRKHEHEALPRRSEQRLLQVERGNGYKQLR